MSQSPIDDFSPSKVTRYQQGWQALNRLLHEERSFSGHERHCAYLNDRQGRFANVSAVTGLDFAEDGRALGPVDWDFDGDLDLWITNRTAPRVRFMRNEVASDNTFLALYLIGDGREVNRDAIGARVEVQAAKTLIKSKHAGEAFLSQASGWMHFGLGEHRDPVTVTVRWPNGPRETFSNVSVNGFHVLRQGSGSAVAWTPPKESAQFAETNVPLDLPDSESEARIILPDGLALPTLSTHPEGKPITLNGQTTLVNVWGSFCRPCLEELGHWTASADAFAKAGIDVLLLNADPDDAGRAKATKLLKKLEVPFRHAMADENCIRSLDIVQRATLDLWLPLPVPSSFLVDKDGYVMAIYKGPVSVETVIADSTLATLDPVQRRMAAVPFPGVWTHDPSIPDPLRVSSQFVDHDLVDAGLAYLRKATEMDQTLRAERFSNSAFGDRYFVMATLLRAQAKDEQAIAAYQQAAKLNSKDVRAPSDLGDYFDSLNRPAEALQSWQTALAITPQDLQLTGKVAMAHLRLNQAKESLPIFARYLKAQPNDAQMHFYRGIALQRSRSGETGSRQFPPITGHPAERRARGQQPRLGARRPSGRKHPRC